MYLLFKPSPLLSPLLPAFLVVTLTSIPCRHPYPRSGYKESLSGLFSLSQLRKCRALEDNRPFPCHPSERSEDKGSAQPRHVPDSGHHKTTLRAQGITNKISHLQPSSLNRHPELIWARRCHHSLIIVSKVYEMQNQIYHNIIILPANPQKKSS